MILLLIFLFIILYATYEEWAPNNSKHNWHNVKSGPGDEEGTLYVLEQNIMTSEYRAFEVDKYGREEVDVDWVKSKIGGPL